IVGFAAYLKWQPFMLRMWLPLFVIAIATVARTLSTTHWLVQSAFCIFLVDGSRLPLLKSWIRPLLGSESLFVLSREDLYFNDMKTYRVREKFDRTMQELRASPCRDIAMDINHFQLEYPIQALILKDHPDTRFVHVNTGNPSRKYEIRMNKIKPCLVVCVACDR
ncbi:MAG: hypothetical protein NTW74_25785, partial [Acidobacteria bacterium]|nr:hypothetical protein [Acidobacteriota bacterium]